MDAATAWLIEHDMEYETSRRSWRHLNDDGEYGTPSQEIPSGSSGDLAHLVATGRGKFVESVDHRQCDQCDTLFVPLSAIHIHCSELCRGRARKSRATYMRAYRAATKRDAA